MLRRGWILSLSFTVESGRRWQSLPLNQPRIVIAKSNSAKMGPGLPVYLVAANISQFLNMVQVKKLHSQGQMMRVSGLRRRSCSIGDHWAHTMKMKTLWSHWKSQVAPFHHMSQARVAWILCVLENRENELWVLLSQRYWPPSLAGGPRADPLSLGQVPVQRVVHLSPPADLDCHRVCSRHVIPRHIQIPSLEWHLGERVGSEKQIFYKLNC